MVEGTLHMTPAQYREYKKTGRLPLQEAAPTILPASALDQSRIIPQVTSSYVSPELRRKANPRPKHVPGAMNKTEAAYAREILEPGVREGLLQGWQFEPLSLRLAKATHYQPDFLVIEPDGISFVEIKGTHAEDDAIAKWKIAASLHWWATFKWVVIQMKSGRIADMKETIYKP